MANNISGFGGVVNIIASNTFPVGFPVTQWADDSDPLDFSSVRVADTAMGVNGDLISWSRAASLPMVLNVIPGSQDDINLQILADANRVGQGKNSADDTITATVVYPDNTVITLTGGKLTDAQFGKGISSAGRLKTKSYAFSFEAKN
jgi:hypothetical protein